MLPVRPRRRRSHRPLRAETLEARYALATYTVNTPGALLDADLNDGVWDVDLQTPGSQLTLAAAAQAINADGSGNVLFGIDGTFSSATFNAPVSINGQQHNVDLAGGELKLNQSGTVENLKLANGNVSVSGDSATIQNNTITSATGTNSLLVQGNTATIKNNAISNSTISLFGNGNTFQNNTVTGAGIQLQGNSNVVLSNNVYQSPIAGISLAGNNNRIESNLIGTDGTVDLGHAGDGVRLVAAPGGSTGNVILKNLISGNGGYGISIRDALTTNTRVEDNRIGTNTAGTAAIANTLGGVLIENAVNNTIGGTTAGTGNVISGNTGDGVRITGTTSTGNLIFSNAIGQALGSTTPLPNGGSGVVISGGQNNKIGEASGGNIISGNLGNGVLLTNGAKANLVRGNVIGTSVNDSAVLGNGGDGIRIENATENLIDGTGAANRIAGNAGAGVRIVGQAATKNLLVINVIGLNFAGAPLPNQQGGVTIENGASQNVIGGKNDKRNVISGNAQWGLAINGASNNQVSGNFIGTNVAGSAGAGPQPLGVLIENGAQNNRLGILTGLGDANLISGNTSHGVQIRGTGTTGNTLAGNVIGIGANLQTAIPNGGFGIMLSDHAAQNTIGVALAQHGQIIAANALGGIAIIEQASQNTVQNNIIGFSPSIGTVFTPSGVGVLLDNAQNNLIGDPAFAFPNFIRNLQQAGVRVQGGSLGNRVQGNSITANGDLGISLETTLAQLPRQANIRQVTRTVDKVTFDTEVLAAPGSTVRIDFYANRTADPSGFGEGELPLGSTNVAVPANGLAQISVPFNFSDTNYTHFTAVLTDAAGTTYSFSRATTTTHVVTSNAVITANAPINDVQPIILILTLTSAGAPTGAVEFYDGNTLLGTAVVNGNKQAGLSVQLSQGQHTVTAVYKGAPTFAGAIATPITLNVVQGPPNVPPVANTDNPSVLEDGSVVINVLANDTDPDGGTINPTTVVITQQPAHGTATINAVTGAITYTPETNYDGPDTLRYTVKDNRNGTSNAGLVNITVTDIPEPWHHKASPLDVDGDGSINLSDVAFVLTILNALGPGPLPTPNAGFQPPPYVDVDGDNLLTPTDVILVQNAVNAGASAEQVDVEIRETERFEVEIPEPIEVAPIVVAQQQEDESTTTTANLLPASTEPAAKVEGVAVPTSSIAVSLWPAERPYYFALNEESDDVDFSVADGGTKGDQLTLDELFAHWQ